MDADRLKVAMEAADKANDDTKYNPEQHLFDEINREIGVYDDRIKTAAEQIAKLSEIETSATRCRDALIAARDKLKTAMSQTKQTFPSAVDPDISKAPPWR